MELAEFVLSRLCQEVKLLLLFIYNNVIGYLPLIKWFFALFFALECLPALLGNPNLLYRQVWWSDRFSLRRCGQLNFLATRYFLTREFRFLPLFNQVLSDGCRHRWTYEIFVHPVGKFPLGWSFLSSCRYYAWKCHTSTIGVWISTHNRWKLLGHTRIIVVLSDRRQCTGLLSLELFSLVDDWSTFVVTPLSQACIAWTIGISEHGHCFFQSVLVFLADSTSGVRTRLSAWLVPADLGADVKDLHGECEGASNTIYGAHCHHAS